MKKILTLLTFLVFSFSVLSSDLIEIHYKSNWPDTLIQFNSDNNGWAKLPTPEEKSALIKKYGSLDKSIDASDLAKFYFNNLGIEGNYMEDSPYFSGYKTFKIQSNNLRFKFSNGKDDVDNNNGHTYLINEPGRYIVSDKTVTKLPEENIKVYYKSDVEELTLAFTPSGTMQEEKLVMKKDRFYQQYYSALIPFTKEIKFLKSGKTENYQITKPGIYKVENQKLEKINDIIPVGTKTSTILLNTEKYSYIKYRIDNMEWSEKTKVHKTLSGKKFFVFDNSERVDFILEGNKGETSKELSVSEGTYSFEPDEALKKISNKKAFSSFENNHNPIVIYSQERDKKNYLNIKSITSDSYELSVSNSSSFYSLKTSANSYNKVDILKDGILVKTVALLENSKEGTRDAANINLPKGKLIIKFYTTEEEKDNTAYTQNEENYENQDVLLLTYGGWKESLRATDVFQAENKNYNEGNYNMWLDFVVPNEYLGSLLKLVFINNSGPTIKEYPAYKNGTLNGFLKYSIDIPNVIDETKTKNSEVFFKIYVGNKVLGMYKYNLKGIVDKSTAAATKEFFPYETKFLGINAKDDSYLFDAKATITSTKLADVVFYDGYYNKNKDYTNELTKIDGSEDSIKMKISKQKDKSLLLSWTATEYKTFELYRSENPLTGFQKIYSGTTKEFSETLPKPNKVYYYRVQSKDKEGNAVYSNVVSASYEEKTKMNISLSKTNENYDSIEISWSVPENVKKYIVYRSVNNNEFRELATVNFYNNRFVDEDLNPQTKYSYMVKAITEENEEIESNKVEKRIYKMERVYGISFEYDLISGLKISWDKIPTYDNYLIEKTSKTTKKEANTRGTQYYDKEIELGKEYTYRIFALEN